MADDVAAARGIADCCERSGGFCGNGLMEIVERLARERDYAKWDESRYLAALARVEAREAETRQLRAELSALREAVETVIEHSNRPHDKGNPDATRYAAGWSARELLAAALAKAVSCRA